MDKGIITVSFDDGRLDTYETCKNILELRKIPAVIYIPSGYIETRFNDPLEIGYNGLMTKSNLDYLQSNPLFEIGGHGYMHRNEMTDIKMGLELLKKWYPNIHEFGFASPKSTINKSYVESHIKEFQDMGFSYVRGGRNFVKYMTVKRGISLLARKTKSTRIFVGCYKSSVNKNRTYYIHAIPVHKLTTLKQVKGMIDYCAKSKCWAILEFHGIDKRDSKEYQEEFCWAQDDFIKVCDYLCELRKRNLIDVMNPLDLLHQI